MEEFRAQLDAYGAETGEDYLLTRVRARPVDGMQDRADGSTRGCSPPSTS